MSRVRLHIPPRLILEDSERRHLIDVLRLRAGDQLEVFDGKCGVCLATLVRDENRYMLELSPREQRPDRGPVSRMGIALLKGRKLDQLVRMLTEIGVDEIKPFTSERSISRPSPAKLENRQKRWRTIAQEAARQSGRTSILDMSPCSSLEIVLGFQPGEATGPAVRALLHEKATGTTLKMLLEENPIGERLVLVGPEGGFTESEVASAHAAGFSVVGLGLPVLRAETAAIVAAALTCLDRRPLVE